jgi:trimethylamine--corrinoid protein Co-methyltransferase
VGHLGGVRGARGDPRGGVVWTQERAHRLFKDIVGSFEEPPMDAGAREELAEFVARRKREGGAPTDF